MSVFTLELRQIVVRTFFNSWSSLRSDPLAPWSLPRSCSWTLAEKEPDFSD